MSHTGKMRRGELNRNPWDREYFLKNSKPKEEVKVIKTIEQMNKKELQEECVKQEKDFTEEMTKAELIETINFKGEDEDA